MIAPVTLSGRHVTLVPLAQEHAPALAKAVRDGELWRLWYTTVPEPEAMAAEIDRRLALQAQGSMLPFAVLDADGVPVGMTTYMNIDLSVPVVEIGSTWYARRVQRTGLNTEAKLLLLGHAFDVLDCASVQLVTHVHNLRSRRAIERLGARLDGVLRAHRRMQDGTLRDSACYSIIASEWPPVRSNLLFQLDRTG